MTFGGNGFQITIFTNNKEQLYEEIKQDLINTQRDCRCKYILLFYQRERTIMRYTKSPL